MKFFVFYLITAVVLVCGRLTSNLRSSELELVSKPEKNETKSFSVQWGPNNCIPYRWIDHLYKQSDEPNEKYNVYVDTNEPEMTVNLWDRGKKENIYVGFINCLGSFTTNYRKVVNSYLSDTHVPIINGNKCDPVTGEDYRGELIYFYDLDNICIYQTIVKVHDKCFFEIRICL